MRFFIVLVLLSACSSWEKVSIEPNQCNSEEVVKKFQEKTKQTLSRLSNISKNFDRFTDMEKVRCMGHDFPSTDGNVVCAKKCRPYNEGQWSSKSDAVEVVLSNLDEKIMVVEVTWVPGAIDTPTAAPPKKLSSGLMPAKEEKPKEQETKETPTKTE